MWGSALCFSVLACVLSTTTVVAGGAPEPPLHAAVQSRDLDKVRAALAAGAEVNERCASGRTALLEATEPGQGGPVPDIVAALLQAGADPNLRSPQSTALGGAIRDLSSTNVTASRRVVTLLLEKGADPLEPVGDAARSKLRPASALRASLRGRSHQPLLEPLLDTLATAELAAWEKMHIDGAAEVQADALIWGSAATPRRSTELLAQAERELDDAQRKDSSLFAVTFAKGFPRLVRSARVEGMKRAAIPVVLGFCPPADTASRLEYLQTFLDPSITARRVSVPLAAIACPTVPDVRPAKSLTLFGTARTLVATGVNESADGPEQIVFQLRDKTGALVELLVTSGVEDEGCRASVALRSTSAVVVTRSCAEKFVPDLGCTFPEETREARFSLGRDGIHVDGDLESPRDPSTCGE